MADGTHIEWTDATWNPITGCAIVSKGCTNCYAMKLAGTRLRHHPSRVGLTKATKAGPVWTGEVRFNEQWLDQPLRWKAPRKIFVCAHGDLFAEGVPDEWIDRVFAVMALCPQHTFQVLTKRPDRMRAYINGQPSTIPYLGRMPLERIHLEAAGHMEGDGGFMDVLKEHGNVYSLYLDTSWPLPNVWLGTSAEDQPTADQRIPELLATPAAVRFVSAEPLLGAIDFARWLPRVHHHPANDLSTPENREALGAIVHAAARTLGPQIDWIIVGGESGPGARPMHPDWARSIRDQCQAAGVAFFFKQWGAWARWEPRFPAGGVAYLDADGGRHNNPAAAGCRGVPMANVGKAAAGRLLDGREWSEFPHPRHAEVPGREAGPRSTHGGAAL